MSFLSELKGVIHIGANEGGEREKYARRGLAVVWVEANPSVHRLLQENIEGQPNQIALNYLLTDRDGEPTTFHVASNQGASSSIFEFAGHKALWPKIDMVERIELTSATFATMAEREGLDLDRYDGLVIDTQGAELLVLQGMGDHLRRFRLVIAEASDFEVYAGAATHEQLCAFMAAAGFGVRETVTFAGRDGVGSCYDIVFENLDGAAASADARGPTGVARAEITKG